MFKNYTVFFAAILMLTMFSSCGFIKIDTSVMKDQLTDFSGTTTYVHNEDCGCYGPTAKGPCTREYAPVCGCDGVTYGNECVALRNGIYMYTKGKCQPTLYPADPPIIYPNPREPIVTNPSQPQQRPELKPKLVRPGRGTNSNVPW